MAGGIKQKDDPKLLRKKLKQEERKKVRATPISRLKNNSRTHPPTYCPSLNHQYPPLLLTPPHLSTPEHPPSPHVPLPPRPLTAYCMYPYSYNHFPPSPPPVQVVQGVEGAHQDDR